MTLIFLDFEASSLGTNSFPIEIGWCDENGLGEAHLIRPDPRWLTSGAWDPASEAVHGIALATLQSDGEPVDVVARRAWDALGGEVDVVASDAPDHEDRWLGLLFAAGGVDRRIRIADTYDVLTHTTAPLATMRLPGKTDLDQRVPRRLALDLIADAEETERQRPGVRHRALPDAERHWRIWRAVTDGVERWTRPGALLDYGVHLRQPRIE